MASGSGHPLLTCFVLPSRKSPGAVLFEGPAPRAPALTGVGVRGRVLCSPLGELASQGAKEAGMCIRKGDSQVWTDPVLGTLILREFRSGGEGWGGAAQEKLMPQDNCQKSPELPASTCGLGNAPSPLPIRVLSAKPRGRAGSLPGPPPCAGLRFSLPLCPPAPRVQDGARPTATPSRLSPPALP